MRKLLLCGIVSECKRSNEDHITSMLFNLTENRENSVKMDSNGTVVIILSPKVYNFYRVYWKLSLDISTKEVNKVTKPIAKSPLLD